jgi:hypothetical protein
MAASGQVLRVANTGKQQAAIPCTWHPDGKTRARHRVLGRTAIVNQWTIWLGALTVGGLLIILLVSIILIPQWLYPRLGVADLRAVATAQARIQLQQAQSQLANDARSSVLQGLAGLLVVAGALATWRQVHISREGQITDQFTRAIDQLGSGNLDVRIGGIYALERIAKNSLDDRSTIQYVLAAFVRHHASWPVGAPDGPEHPTGDCGQAHALAERPRPRHSGGHHDTGPPPPGR